MLQQINTALALRLTRHRPRRNMYVCPIIPGKKLAFVAIPKNAGTSIRVAFGVDQGFVGSDEYVRSPHAKPWPGVSTKKRIELLKYLGYLRFCVVRNPWERFVSCWQNKLGSQLFLRRTHGLFRPDMDFPSFLEAAFSVTEKQANRHYKTQVSFIHRKGTLLVDRLLRFENLIEEWDALRSEYELPALPHFKNSGARSTWKQIYQKYPGTQERVAKRYTADIEFLGYGFD